MSRGLGALQRGILETLVLYAKIGDTGWEWRPSNPKGNIASDSDIALYKRGHYVPLWMLRRDLNCTRAELSRAVRSLWERELVFMLDAELSVTSYSGRNCKFVSLW